MPTQADTPLRLLVVLPWIPWPMRTGGKVRAYNVVKALTERSDIRLSVVAPASPSDAQGVAELETLGVAVHGVPARVGRRSVGQHMVGLLSRRPSSMVDRRSDIVEVVRRLWDSGEFDLIQIEFLAMSYAVTDDAMLSRSCISLHFPASLTLRRNLSVLPRLRPTWIYTAIDAAKARSFERRAVEKYRCAFVTSAHDARLMSAAAGANVSVAPNAVDDTLYGFVEHLSTEPIVLSTCNFENPVNVAGVLEFLESVWPRVVAQVPNARYEVVGRNPPASVLRLAGQLKSVVVVGEVDDVGPFFARARASVVIMRAGGGTKLRFLTSLCMGIPVVSTRLGAEGLPVDCLNAVHVADTHDDLATAVIRCIREDPTTADRASLRNFVLQHHTWARTADGMVREYERILHTE